jgi:uncharacterized membrane protein
MTRVQVTADVWAPTPLVFDAITDPKRGSQWNPNILEVSSLTNYPVREGTTWKQKTVMLGRPVQLNCRIASLQPPHRGVLHVSGLQAATITTSCRAIPGGTKVTQEIDFQVPGGRLGSMAAKLITPRMQEELAETLVRLKEIVERESGGSNGSGTT